MLAKEAADKYCPMKFSQPLFTVDSHTGEREYAVYYCENVKCMFWEETLNTEPANGLCLIIDALHAIIFSAL